jgi:uncharacterized protein involved in outer membrane biogenesis
MRKLVIVLAVAAGIAGALVLGAALSLNRIIAGNRERLLTQTEAAIGRPVHVDRLTVSFWGGLGVRMENMRIADDPAFGAAEFVRAEVVTGRARLLSLLRGELEISRIDLTRPEIHLIRDASGRWNYSTLGRHVPAALSELSTGEAPGVIAAAIAVRPDLPLLVTRATLDDGTLELIDRSASPTFSARIEHVGLAVHDIGLNAPMHFEVDAAVQSEAINIHLQGVVGPLNQSGGISVQLTGRLGPFPPQDLRFDDLHLLGAVTADTLRIARLGGRAFGGSFELTGQYPFRQNGTVNLKGHLEHIAVAQILRATLLGHRKPIEGTGELDIDLHATGASADAIRATLAGRLAADIRDGLIPDFNLVADVLSRLNDLPIIGTLVSNRVRPKYSHMLAERDTHFDTLHGSLDIAEQRVRTDDLTFAATDYAVRVNGRISFDRHADMNGMVVMSPRFSSDVAADVKEAKYLMDDNRQLTLPFRLRGILGEARPQPDTVYLAGLLTRSLGHGTAKDLLKQLLGGADRDTQKPPGGDADKTLQDRLRNLLGR